MPDGGLGQNNMMLFFKQLLNKLSFFDVMASVPSPLHSRFTYLYQQQSVKVKAFADENLAKTARCLLSS
jgi:hypothetical protein